VAATLVKSNNAYHAYNSPATSITVNWASGSASAGNLIVACIAVDKDSQAFSAPTCTGGSFDDLIIIQDSGASSDNVSSGAIAYKIAEGGETGITWSYANSEEGNIFIAEFSGIAASPLDQSADDESNLTSADTSQPTGTTGTTDTANELIITMASFDSANSIGGAPPTWTNADSVLYNDADGSDYGSGEPYLTVARRDVTSTSTYNDTASHGGSDQSYGAIAIFREETTSSSSSSQTGWSSSSSQSSSSSSISSSSSSATPTEAVLQDSNTTYSYEATSTETSIATSFSGATAGNLLVAGIIIDKASGTINVPTSSGGTAWQIIEDSGTGANICSGAMAYKVADGGETTVTWSWTTLQRGANIWIGEFSGLTSDPLDQSADDHTYLTTTTETQPTGTTAATDTADELIITMAGCDSVSGPSPDGHFAWANADDLLSNTPSLPDTTGTPYISIWRRDVTSTGTYNDTATWTGSDEAYGAIATFRLDTGSSSSSSTTTSSSSSSQSSSSSSISSSSSDSSSSSSQSSSSSSISSSSSDSFSSSSRSSDLESSSSSGPLQSTVLIPQYDTNWLYLQPDADNTALYTDYNSNPSGDNFTQPDYNDSGWSSGQAGIGYGSGDFGVNTVCNDPGSGSRDQALYLRKHFYAYDVDTIVDWTFQVNIDDGAMIWLNGTEIGRYGIAAGTVIDSTLATHIAGTSTEPDEDIWHTIDFSTPTVNPNDPNWDPTVSDPWSYLVEGENVLVLAVHQQSATSSDQKGDVTITVSGYADNSSSSSSDIPASSSSSSDIPASSSSSSVTPSSSSSSKSSSSSSKSSSSSSDSSSSSSESPAYFFTYGADQRSQTANFEASLTDIVNQGGMGAFHITIGDYDHSTPSTNRDLIDQYFADSDNPEPIWYIPIGNHEIDGNMMTWVRAEYNTGNSLRTPYKNYTNQDGPVGIKETQYSWDWGDIRYIALNIYANNAQDDDEFTLNGVITQGHLDWLEGILQGAIEDGKQTVVISHEPCFDPDFSNKDGDCLDRNETTRDQFYQMMENYSVLAYLNGDSHSFKTFYPTDVVDSTGDFPHESGGDASFPPNRVPQLDIGNYGNDTNVPAGEGQSWGKGTVYSDRIVFTFRRDYDSDGTWVSAIDNTYSKPSYTLYFRDVNPSVFIPSSSSAAGSSSSSSISSSSSSSVSSSSSSSVSSSSSSSSSVSSSSSSSVSSSSSSSVSSSSSSSISSSSSSSVSSSSSSSVSSSSSSSVSSSSSSSSSVSSSSSSSSSSSESSSSSSSVSSSSSSSVSSSSSSSVSSSSSSSSSSVSSSSSSSVSSSSSSSVSSSSSSSVSSSSSSSSVSSSSSSSESSSSSSSVSSSSSSSVSSSSSSSVSSSSSSSSSVSSSSSSSVSSSSSSSSSSVSSSSSSSVSSSSSSATPTSSSSSSVSSSSSSSSSVSSSSSSSVSSSSSSSSSSVSSSSSSSVSSSSSSSVSSSSSSSSSSVSSSSSSSVSSSSSSSVSSSSSSSVSSSSSSSSSSVSSSSSSSVSSSSSSSVSSSSSSSVSSSSSSVSSSSSSSISSSSSSSSSVSSSSSSSISSSSSSSVSSSSSSSVSSSSSSSVSSSSSSSVSSSSSSSVSSSSSSSVSSSSSSSSSVSSSSSSSVSSSSSSSSSVSSSSSSSVSSSSSSSVSSSSSSSVSSSSSSISSSSSSSISSSSSSSSSVSSSSSSSVSSSSSSSISSSSSSSSSVSSSSSSSVSSSSSSSESSSSSSSVSSSSSSSVSSSSSSSVSSSSSSSVSSSSSSSVSSSSSSSVSSSSSSSVSSSSSSSVSSSSSSSVSSSSSSSQTTSSSSSSISSSSSSISSQSSSGIGSSSSSSHSSESSSSSSVAGELKFITIWENGNGKFTTVEVGGDIKFITDRI